MSYDVFVVAALEDRDMAKLVTRRLRALKMRVWYDAKSTDDQFDEKEARAVHRSKAMLVLWSENATKSDFVRAAAGTGYSIKDQPFIQAGLDDVVPYDPYEVDDLHDLKGFTSRTNTDGWFEIIQKLEDQQDRKDLKEFLLIPTKDKDAQDAWRTRHPADPLAIKGQPVGVKKTDIAAGAAAAGAIGAASLTSTTTTPTPTTPAKPEPVEIKTAEPANVTPFRTTPPPETDRVTPQASYAAAEEEEIGGMGAIWAMLAAIAVLFLLAFIWRNMQAATGAAPVLPGVANAVFATCPAGTVQRDLLDPALLEPSGGIVNDTGE
ncbi:MAG: toll/interleukin-1 receptor domain-containing protein [Pseudomonadota bacterium]